jgi:hypothetical protein
MANFISKPKKLFSNYQKFSRNFIFIFSVVIILFFNNSLFAASDKIIKIDNFNPVLIGKSELKFFSLKVYDIALWGENEKFSYDQKLAIQINYNMNFKREELAKKSVEEIDRLHNLNENQKKDYYQKFLSIFANIKKGDEKIAYFSPQSGVEMYYNQKKIGEIKDVKIARLFIDIWLDEKGSYPDVTRKLIGKK